MFSPGYSTSGALRRQDTGNYANAKGATLEPGNSGYQCMAPVTKVEKVVKKFSPSGRESGEESYAAPMTMSSKHWLVGQSKTRSLPEADMCLLFRHKDAIGGTTLPWQCNRSCIGLMHLTGLKIRFSG